MYVVILAGGNGKRLWPVSNCSVPKPFLKIKNNLSLLQNTIIRASKIRNLSKIIIVANSKYIKNVVEDCKNLSVTLDIEIIVEHYTKNTTAAIAAAAIYIESIYGPNNNILVLPCDHIISKEGVFYENIDKLNSRKLVSLTLFGIPPTSNNSSYGYIKYQDNKVLSFIEKPNKKDTINFVQSGNYLWNSGIIYAEVSVLLKEIKHHSYNTWNLITRAIHNSVTSYGSGYKEIRLRKESTLNIIEDSIDYEILQKSNNLNVIKCDIGWKEIGDLNSFCNAITTDINDNNIYGNATAYNTSNCYIQSKEKCIITVGVNNLLVVETDDKIFVVDKNITPNFLSESIK
ncbi:MAG: mannose-1-phosphate guanylyltransferase [Rickettsiaceae bacterium]|nr:mannose-1-phosphate guanylyltransferase [Rickettsiaceae bacterium]